MNVLAEGKTFLVDYPEQGTSANGSRCWDVCQATDQQRNVGEPSSIAGITHQIISEYHVNVRQVYAVGLSSGGAMATIMAATYPDLYAAIGVHSGLPYGAANDLPSAFAAMKQVAPQHAWSLSEFFPLIVFHVDRHPKVVPVNHNHMLGQ